MGVRSWVANGLAGSAMVHPAVRWVLLRAVGVRVGQARIMHGGTFSGKLANLTIGNNVYINTGVSLHPTGGLVIEDNVSIGPRCIVMTGTHDIGGPTKRAAEPPWHSPVTIGAGTWLGAGVIVYAGVTVGPGCIIAPGAVVTGDCEPNTLYGGVPARPIRKLEE